MDTFNQLDKTFDIVAETPKAIKKPKKETLVLSEKSEDMEKDYAYVRSNLYDMVEKVSEAVADALEVAQQSEHPRAFEVCMNGAKATAEVAEKLTELHMKTKALEAESPDAPKAQHVQNNMFVGSTAELMMALKESK